MCFAFVLNTLPKWLLKLHRCVLGVMKIMILLRGACVRESVFNDTHRKVTNTGGCVLLFKDRKCRGGTCTAQLRLPAPQADSHSDGLQLCLCVLVRMCWGGGREAEMMGWLAQVHVLLIRVKCTVVAASPSGWSTHLGSSPLCPAEGGSWFS